MDAEAQLARLPSHLRDSVRQHCVQLQSRVRAPTDDHQLACIIVSTKVLDDENEYDNTFWSWPESPHTIKQVNKMEATFLQAISWRASVCDR